MKNKLHMTMMVVVFAVMLFGAIYVHQAAAAEDCDGYRPYPVYPWCYDDPEPEPTPTQEARWWRWFPIWRPIWRP